MNYSLAGRVEFEEWLWKNVPSSQYPHDDILARDTYRRAWIVYQGEYDEWLAMSPTLSHEDPKDSIGVTLDKLSYPVEVYG